MKHYQLSGHAYYECDAEDDAEAFELAEENAPIEEWIIDDVEEIEEEEKRTEKRDIHINASYSWLKNAVRVVEEYGGHVDWEEGFYLCPECGEPIYNEDWSENSLEEYLCPVCELEQ